MEKEIKEYLDYLLVEKKLSINTIESYKTDLKYYLDYFNMKSIKNINKKDITKFIESLKDKDLNEKTINHIIGTVKSFHGYFSLYHNISNVTENIVRLKTKKTLPKVLTIEEVELILDIDLKTPFDYRNKI